ncbi:MAG: peroxiredoxin-like family protein [Pseudomonadota bacterium]
MTMKLTPDTQAPDLAVDLVGGGRFDLVSETPENFTMVVFYRGYHCPICKSYLGTLNGLIDQCDTAGVSVVALSMDGAERAAKTAEEWALSNLRLGYGLDEATARSWGLYISKAIRETEADVFCEPGLFWIRPDGRLYLIDISNMPFARPDVAFLISKAAFVVEKGYPARGGD